MDKKEQAHFEEIQEKHRIVAKRRAKKIIQIQILQIGGTSQSIVALCEDGTLWTRKVGMHNMWFQLENEIPWK